MCESETEAQRRRAQVPRQSVHHGPCRAYITALGEQQVAPLPRRGAEPRCRAGAYITALGEQQVARLPRETDAQRRGAQVPRQSVHHGPWRSASRAPATQRRGAQVPRQSVHHGPWRAASRAPATRNCRTEARSPGAAPERTSRTLESSKSRACHAN